jgi:hypothetical protein
MYVGTSILNNWCVEETVLYIAQVAMMAATVKDAVADNDGNVRQ